VLPYEDDLCNGILNKKKGSSWNTLCFSGFGFCEELH